MNLADLNNLISELNERVGGARISKIYQPQADLLVLKLWTGQATQRLLISVEPGAGRLHLTEMERLNPGQPPRFCQLLRARVGRIVAFSLINQDRLVRVHCTGRQGDCFLIVELTGHTGNLLLLDEQEQIIDLLFRRSSPGSRELLPGSSYVPPPLPAATPTGKRKAASDKPEELNWSEYVEKVYTTKQSSATDQDYRRQLHKTIARQQQKLRRRHSGIEADLLRQENAEELKQTGELILANLGQLKRGMARAELVNYFASPPEPLEVELDPMLNPQDNAARYFKRYRKASRGVFHSRRRLQETGLELRWLDQLAYQLDDCVSAAELEELGNELRSAGLLRETNRLHRRRTQPHSTFDEHLSPAGLRVLRGRNNRQNDQLSSCELKPGDLWFHVRDAPGSHVVLKAAGRDLSSCQEDVNFAASIAAGYSKKRQETKVEVMVAEAGAVQKPKATKLGLVTVKHSRTVVVTPRRQ